MRKFCEEGGGGGNKEMFNMQVYRSIEASMR